MKQEIRYNSTMDWLVIPLEALERTTGYGLYPIYKSNTGDSILGGTFLEYIEVYKGNKVVDLEDYPKLRLYDSSMCLLETEYNAGMTCCELIVIFADDCNIVN